MSADFNPQFSKLGEILVHNGKATEGGINEALVQQKTTNDKIGITMIEMGMIEEDDFATAYSQQLGYRKADNFILLEADSSKHQDRTNHYHLENLNLNNPLLENICNYCYEY